MTDVALKEFLEEKINALRRELAIQREADMRALAVERDNLRNTIRIDTLKWIVGSVIAGISAVATWLLWRKT